MKATTKVMMKLVSAAESKLRCRGALQLRARVVRASVTAVLGGALMVLSLTPVQAQSIGWSYTFDATSVMASGETAGYPPYGQSFWNNDPVQGQTSPGGVSDLLDSSGASSGASMTWSVADVNNWHMSDLGGTPTGDAKINHGFLSIDADLVLTGIPYSCYTVVAYYNNNEVDGDTLISLFNGATLRASRPVLSRTAGVDTEVSTFADYIVGTGSMPLASSNVTVFEGLQDASLTITFREIGSGNTNTGPTAFQIVNTNGACLFQDGFESGNTNAWSS